MWFLIYSTNKHITYPRKINNDEDLDGCMKVISFFSSLLLLISFFMRIQFPWQFVFTSFSSCSFFIAVASFFGYFLYSHRLTLWLNSTEAICTMWQVFLIKKWSLIVQNGELLRKNWRKTDVYKVLPWATPLLTWTLQFSVRWTAIKAFFASKR